MIVSVVAAGALGAIAYGVYEPNAGLFGRAVGRGPRQERAIYLTFDDGPSPDWTPRILESLDRYSTPAAFFMVGQFVRSAPALARTVAAAGHLVGNHTTNHVKLHVRSPARIRREIAEAHTILTDATGSTPRAFRAPHGYRNPFVARVTHSYGYTVFGWTFGVWDTARPGPEEIRRRVRSKLVPGAIVLLHDGDGYDPHGDRSQTAAALPGIIADARDAGYTIEPLSRLLP